MRNISQKDYEMTYCINVKILVKNGNIITGLELKFQNYLIYRANKRCLRFSRLINISFKIFIICYDYLTVVNK